MAFGRHCFVNLPGIFVLIGSARQYTDILGHQIYEVISDMVHVGKIQRWHREYSKSLI